MSTLRAHWDSWWFAQVPPHALAIFRIFFGLFLLVYASTYSPHVSLLFSRSGVVLALFEGMASPTFDWILLPPSPLIAWCIFVSLIIAILCMTAGFCFRVATFFLIALALYYWQLQLHMYSTVYNRILFFLLCTLACSGAHKTYSVWSYISLGSWVAWKPISVFPQRLIAFQITATYLGVGWQKQVLPDWSGGEILTYPFITYSGSSLAFWIARLNLPLDFYDALVWCITWWECLMPFGLWHKKSRVYWMAAGILFHASIAVLLSIWWFLFLPLTYVLFFDPEVVRVYFEKRLGRKKEISKDQKKRE